MHYAEPNKLYEAMYFETPIVVSAGTFLEKRVKTYGIGYAIDAMNDTEVQRFVSHLTMEDIAKKRQRAALLDKKEAINDNSAFFWKLERKICDDY